jgi:hypothetical protein
VDPVSIGPNFAGLPTPHGLKFNEWAQIAVEQFVQYGLPVAPDEDGWQDWATSFTDGTMPGYPAPSPLGFTSWQDWASALIGTIA